VTCLISLPWKKIAEVCFQHFDYHGASRAIERALNPRASAITEPVTGIEPATDGIQHRLPSKRDPPAKVVLEGGLEPPRDFSH
jgi:hypothetical protein